jgi:hypothetical protein
MHHAPQNLHKGLVYTREGFGAWVTPSELPKPFPTDTPLHRAILAYSQGRWTDVEHEAPIVIASTAGATSGQTAHDGLLARSLLAYTSARQKRFEQARDRFEALRDAASKVAGHGPEQGRMGEPLPTYEEEAALQHAVCTGALGDKEGSEYEYRQFLINYPESILVHAAVKRVRKLHSGNCPAEVEKLWTRAMQIQHDHDMAVRREQSMCGPKCLAELLRRKGQKADVHALADEMKTTHEGTTMADLAETAKAHGVGLQGVELTEQGLEKQPLPAIALLGPGHYVVLDRVLPAGVSFWDPNRPSADRSVPASEWQRQFTGMALVTH